MPTSRCPSPHSPVHPPTRPPACAAGFVHSRPEVLYFWFYFVIVNAIWIVVPSAVILRTAGKIATHAVEVEGELLAARSGAANGKVRACRAAL
jgi:hypothetical protein